MIIGLYCCWSFYSNDIANSAEENVKHEAGKSSKVSEEATKVKDKVGEASPNAEKKVVESVADKTDA